MPSVCFYFQMHQPYRLKRFRVFDIGRGGNYFDETGEVNRNNERVLKKVAAKSYLPATTLLHNLLRRHPEFKVSFSLSGVLLDQLEAYAPEVIDLFLRLAATGRVEFLSETYHHSLASLYSPEEFSRQVLLHRNRIEALFGVRPRVFRNTELIYCDDIGRQAEAMGFTAVLAEGADHILGWRSPNFIYRPPGAKRIKLLLKNYRLSDDVAFRFSSREWPEYPLSAPKFAAWLAGSGGEVVNLFMDYETFGEHQWADTGIFKFLEALPAEIMRYPENNFVTVSEAAARYEPKATLEAPDFFSWADTERDLSAWLGNSMQTAAINQLYELEPAVLASGDSAIINDWRRMQTSDHFYYMCTKWWHDGDVHKYFNPHDSPHDAFISFMNALVDLKGRIDSTKTPASRLA